MTRRARRVLAVGFLAYIILGLVDGAAGPIWPDLRDEFGRTDASFGWTFGALSLGYLLASGVSGHLTKRVGYGTTIVVGGTVNVVAYALLAASPVFAVVPIGFLLGGLGSGLVDPTVNTWVAVRHGSRQLGLLHGFYGVGAVSGPLVATAFIAGFDFWRGAYVLVLFVQVVALAGLAHFKSEFDEMKVEEADEPSESTPPRPGVETTLLVWSLLYVGIEVGFGVWTFTVMTESRNTDEVIAGLISAGFWLGLMAGRFVLAAVDDRVSPESTMTGSSLLAIAAAAWFWIDLGGSGGLSIPVVGLGFAAMFPVAVGRIPAYLGEDRAQFVVGYQFATAAIGAMTIPAVIGFLAGDRGVGVAAPVLFTATVLAAAAWAAVIVMVRQLPSDHATRDR